LANIINEGKYIQSAVELAKKGDRQGATRILSQVLQQNPKNARAWYLLSQVVDDPKKKISCLVKVLEIDPGNTQAIDRLNKLKQPAEPMPEIQPPPPRPVRKTTELYAKPKKGSPWWVYTLLVIGSLVLSCMCCSAFLSEFSPETSDALIDSLDPNHTIVYRVEGTASSAMITYMNDQTGMEQLNKVRLPWQKSYNMKTGSSTSLVAQSNDYGKTITCIIELDGEEWKRSSSSGDFVVVTCTGWIGLD